MRRLVAAILGLALAGSAIAQEAENIPRILAEAAAAYDLPQQIDQTTRLVDVRASGMTLTYFYESSEHGSEADMRTFFLRNNIPKICADEDFVYTFRQGVTFRYSYVLLDEPKPVVIEVTSADCLARG